MMSKNASNKFSFKSCKFRVQKSKEGTGRIAMWRLGIKNSYTMEATFGGSTLGDRRGTHFTTRDLKSLGFYFCDTLLDYCDPDPTKTTYCLTELAALLTKKVRERLGKGFATDCKFSVSDLETSTSGSNSSDSDGLPAHLLKQPQTVPPEQTPVKKKKKRLRSRKERNRLRPERVKNNTQPKVLQSSMKDIESKLPREDTVKEIVQERPVGRHRTKGQANVLIRKAVIPPPTARPMEVSQVTLWHDCKPVKDDGKMNFIHSNQQHHRCTRHPFASYKVYRVLPPSLTAPYRFPSIIYMKMVPDIVPKRLLSSFSSDTFNAHTFRDRNSLRVSEGFFVPEESSTSHGYTAKTRQQNEKQEEDSSVSLLRRKPLGEQNLRDRPPDIPQRESESERNVLVPALRGSDLRGKRLIKQTLEEKRHSRVLSPVSMPSGLMKTELPDPQRDTRHYYSGRESQITRAVVTRPPQSAPL